MRIRSAAITVRCLLTACAVSVIGGQIAAQSAASSAAQSSSYGRIVFPTSAGGEAQDLFVRGVAALHNFEYEAAIAAFQAAQRSRPGFALAYWGEAFAWTQPLWYHEDLPRARAVLARLAPTAAGRAAKAPTERERGYLAAIEALFGAGDRPARFRAAAARFAALAGAHPDDDEAKLFEALTWLGAIPEGARVPELSARAGRIAAEVLRRRPDHPGAAHYVLHAYDDAEHATLALDAARRYARLAPASSHARHMPSHAFLPLGLWDEAGAANEAAYSQSVAAAGAAGRPASHYDYHALAWLQYARLQQGRFNEARELLTAVERALAAVSPDAASRGRADASPPSSAAGAAGAVAAAPPLPSGRAVRLAAGWNSEIGRGYDAAALRNERGGLRARLIVETGDWAAMRGQSSFDSVEELFALGLSSVGIEDYPRAAAVLRELAQAAPSAPDRDAAEAIAIMRLELEGLLAIAAADQKQGLTILARGAQREYARPAPAARPSPPKPAGELYADALLDLGQPAAAVREYRRVLARTPNRALALLGLARAARAGGDVQEAQRSAKAFLTQWHAADRARPELAEARQLAR